MDSIPPAVIDWIIRLAMVGVGGYAAWPLVQWGIAKVRGLKTPTTTDGDNRSELNTALCLLADRAAQTKCDKLKTGYDAAITELSKMVVRSPDYFPPGETPNAPTA